MLSQRYEDDAIEQAAYMSGAVVCFGRRNCEMEAGRKTFGFCLHRAIRYRRRQAVPGRKGTIVVARLNEVNVLKAR